MLYLIITKQSLKKTSSGMLHDIRNIQTLKFRIMSFKHAVTIPGVPKKSSGVWLNAEKKVLNLAISNQSSEMLDIST